MTLYERLRAEADAWEAERRMRELLALGGIPTRIRTRRSVAAKTATAAPRRFLLPEVDPVTMKATGGWREFVEVKP